MKFIKYFFVGGIAAGVDFLIFALFVKILEWPWFISGIAGFILATIVNYLLSIKHVFTSGARFKKHKEIMLIFFVSFIGLIVNQLILWQCIDFVLLDPLIAKITATGVVFFWNYAARNHFIFKAHKKIVSHEVVRGLGIRYIFALMTVLVMGAIFSSYYYYNYGLSSSSILWSTYERIKIVFMR